MTTNPPIYHMVGMIWSIKDIRKEEEKDEKEKEIWNMRNDFDMAFIVPAVLT